MYSIIMEECPPCISPTCVSRWGGWGGHISNFLFQTASSKKKKWLVSFIAWLICHDREELGHNIYSFRQIMGTQGCIHFCVTTGKILCCWNLETCNYKVWWHGHWSGERHCFVKTVTAGFSASITPWDDWGWKKFSQNLMSKLLVISCWFFLCEWLLIIILSSPLNTLKHQFWVFIAQYLICWHL